MHNETEKQNIIEIIGMIVDLAKEVYKDDRKIEKIA